MIHIFHIISIKLQTFKEANKKQLENILFILITLLVLKLNKLKKFKEEHPFHISKIISIKIR